MSYTTKSIYLFMKQHNPYVMEDLLSHTIVAADITPTLDHGVNLNLPRALRPAGYSIALAVMHRSEVPRQLLPIWSVRRGGQRKSMDMHAALICGNSTTPMMKVSFPGRCLGGQEVHCF